MRFIGALVLTYFVSRVFRRLGLRPPSTSKLIAAHLLSLIVISLLVIAMRYPIGLFDLDQLGIYLGAQLIWLAIDAFRSRIALWKAPVAAPTEPASRARAGSTR